MGSTIRLDGIELNSAENATVAEDRLRNKLWTGLMITNLVVVIVSRIVRTMRGEYNSTTSWVNTLVTAVIFAVIFAAIALRNSKYAQATRSAYTLMLHLVTPVVLILFGGTGGFGDIAIIVTVMVSLLHGWRRWMIVTTTISIIVLSIIVYLDSTEQPLTPILSYSSDFTTIKFTVSMTAMVMITYFLNTFYRNLLAQYRHNALQLSDTNTSLLNSQIALESTAKDLQASRLNLVTVREEERRRLRRDLHDGLGPTLAAQIFRVGAIRNNLRSDPDKSDELLEGLEVAIEKTLTDVRRLVYALRPPMLDQLGLLGAIENHLSKLTSVISIKSDFPDSEPVLNAATEVACFRIITTAVDNVVQHAKATTCHVSLDLSSTALTLSVVDDGIGIDSDRLEGVGLTSMRERTDELGGSFLITKNAPTGTHLKVTIPLVVS